MIKIKIGRRATAFPPGNRPSRLQLSWHARAISALGDAPYRSVTDAFDPSTTPGAPRIAAYLAPPASTAHPSVIFGLSAAAPEAAPDPARAPERGAAMMAELRAAGHVWPEVVSGAIAVSHLIVAQSAARAETVLEAARMNHEAEGIAVLAPSGFRLKPDIKAVTSLAQIDPDALRTIILDQPSPVLFWAALAGIDAWIHADASKPDVTRWFASARAVDPWRHKEIPVQEAMEILGDLRRDVRRNRARVIGVGMSGWKQRCVAPFLNGPAGPPIFEPTLERALSRATPGSRIAVWGGMNVPDEQIAGGQHELVRIEDGFLRSVGLGVKHVPPASLTIDTGPPYFDARTRNSFENCVQRATFTPELSARARRLGQRIVEARVSKYNLAQAGRLPDTDGQTRILVPGQVEGDLSIAYGARLFHSNTAFLKAARDAFPDAFIVYKPHPDVLTGRRPGKIAASDIAALADHEEHEADMPTCLDWAERVVVLTSLAGFEALLRDIPVTTFGRPFYAGWGLTDDRDPPPRARRLTREELIAASLILYPRYIDPVTRLPTRAERVVEALAEERARARSPHARLRTAWRNSISWFTTRM